MRKSTTQLDKRAKYVQKEINERHASESISMAVYRLSERLFLSEPTIWRDYARVIITNKK